MTHEKYIIINQLYLKMLVHRVLKYLTRRIE